MEKKDLLKKMIKGMKLHDAGESYGEPVSVAKEGPRKTYPSLYMNMKQAPFLKEKSVGEECFFIVKGVLTEHSKSSYTNKESFRIEVKEIGSYDSGK